MKAVLINSWYKQYSTGKLVYEYNQFLKKNGISTKVYFGHGEETDEPGVSKISDKISIYFNAAKTRITGREGCFATRQTKDLIKEIDSFEPDTVYLFNLHAYYLNFFLLLEHLKKKRYKTIYMLFDEYPYLGKCCFAENCIKFQTICRNCPRIKDYPKSLLLDQSTWMFNKKRLAFCEWDNITLAGVEFLKKQASVSTIAHKCKFRVLDMGVDLESVFFPRETSDLKERFGIKDGEKIVLTVGLYSDKRKGIQALFDVANECKHYSIRFINIGYDGGKKTLPSNCIGVEYVSDQVELAKYYSLADIYVMTSTGEAMSLTCMEALGCGCRIVGYDISGTPYATKGTEYGKYVMPNNRMALKEAIIKAPRKTKISISEIRQYALSRYRIEDFCKNLYEI